MRKFLLITWLLCTVLVIKATPEDVKVGNLWYSVTVTDEGKSAIVIKPQNSESYTGTVTIPSTISGTFKNETPFTDVPVTEIRQDAFKSQTGVTSVVIEEGVTLIGSNAFNGASQLVEISIPESVVEIKGGAFSGCTKLGKVTFGSIKSLCNISFEKDNSNPIYYAKGFYISNEQIKTLVIPCDAVSISDYAFNNCTSLTSLTIEEGVTSIGKSAFSSCTSLTSVSIPSTITQIGEDAFNIASGTLTKATFSSVKDLCNIDFVNVRSNPLYVANHLYIDENEQTSVTLPYVSAIKPRVFAGASFLESVSIPSVVKFIGEDAFLNCTKIGTVSYSSSDQLTTMQYDSSTSNPLYYGATPVVEGLALGTLEFATDISNDAFTNAKWLTEIKVGPNVTSIGDRAFSGCSNLSKITFSGTPTLQRIGQEAFRSCSSLREIDLPESLTTLGTLAFRSTSLTEISIPSACTDIGTSVFEWCTRLTTVNFDSSSGLTTIPNYIFNNCSNLTTVTLPDGIEAIGEGAFKNCSKLAAPPMSQSLTTIGKSAFDGCKGFTNLMLSETGQLSEIGESAFNNCSNITMVSLPATIDIINDNAFSGCTSLADIYILRETVPTRIYQHSFGDRESQIVLHVETEDAKTAYENSNDIWKNFKEIVTKSNSTLTFYINENEDSKYCVSGEAGKPFDHAGIPDYSGNGLFTGWWDKNGQIVEVPAVMPSGDMDFYGYLASEYNPGKFTYLLQPAETKNNRRLEARATIIGHSLTQSDTKVEISASVSVNANVYAVDSIAPDVFVGAEMYSVSLPESVKAIGNGAFKNCQNLQSVNIPATLTTISDHLFEGCTGLTSIEIPATVKRIGYQAFNNTGLTEITIPATITEMDNEVFKECKKLEKAVFGEGFTLPVPKYTFWKCTNLKDVTLMGTMGVIGLNAFQECDSLKTIELPEGISFISAYAFAGCKVLNRITLPATISMIGSQAFNGCTKLAQITVNKTGSTPAAATDAFDEATYNTAFLYVENKTLYQSADPWKKFTNIATQTNYNLVYKVDSDDYKTVSLKAGSTITPEAKPEGYGDREFSGWKELPDIMPANDITVEGCFKYELKFYENSVADANRMLKNEVYQFFFGDKVVLPVAALPKPGYKYSLTGLTDDAIDEDNAADVDITMDDAKDLNVIVTYRKAEDEMASNYVKYRIYMLENRAEVIGCDTSATTLKIPATVIHNGKSYPVTVITGSAFHGNVKLTTVTINNSVKVIGNEAFSGCKALTTVTMPATLDSIGQQAFANTILTAVTVPYAPRMGKEIFYWCTKLSDISFSTSLTTLPERLFQGCLSLKEVTLPDHITAIGDYAFAGCTGIERLTLPKNIQQLGEYAFWNVFGNGDELVFNGTTLPVASENTFDEEAYQNALLNTTASTTQIPWSNFANNEGSTSPQCKKPTIEYAGGKLKFACDTEEATIVSTVSIADSGENTANEVELSKEYTVTAYAKKDGYRRSETVTKKFTFMNGDVNLDGEIDIADVQMVINRAIGKTDALAPKLEVEIESEQDTLDPQ